MIKGDPLIILPIYDHHPTNDLHLSVVLHILYTYFRIPTPVPTWGLRLKHEMFYAPDFILRWKYPNLNTTTLDVGGHFAAFEKPKEFADDVFKAIKSFRELRI